MNKRTPTTITCSFLIALTLGLAACGSADALDTGSDVPAEPDTEVAVPLPDDADQNIAPDEDDSTTLDESGPEDDDFNLDPIMDIESVREAVVGLPIEEANAWAADNNMEIRVVSEDGEDFVMTMDYANWRINAVVTDGVVTDATDIG